ncbi:MAG: prmC, pSRTUE45c [Frondihabitans sp.]|nr:prmC, pSRTUE45c [Frondihabitans sp.]
MHPISLAAGFDDVVIRLRSSGSVFAEEEAALLIEAATGGGDLDALVALRVAGKPLEQILGWAAFRGLRIAVAEGVFVPRSRTSLLVDEALSRAPGVVLDICCGSGAAGAAVEAERPEVEVVASDLDPRAVACARTNLRHPDRVFEGDLFDALPSSYRGRFDVIVANAPYVPTDEIEFMPQEARLHEPTMALDGGADGVAIQRRVARGAPAWLAPGGALIIETSVRQADLTAALMADVGFSTRIRHDDDLDATLVMGVDPYE